MGGEMGTHLQQTLRKLCLETEWKYAVFWKLKHQARMILTWEDAYYDNHELPEHSENMCFSDTLVNMHDASYLPFPLGLALAKMSYLVYSLGEGIIGQVAVTGKHQWIFADMPASSSWSLSEYCDGWQTQFSAGIRTVAVIAVVPLGVVQLGSLNTVIEDLKLVNHIKDAFCLLQNSYTEFLPNPIQYTMKTTLCPSGTSIKNSDLEIYKDRLLKPDKGVSNIKPDIQSHLLPCHRNPYDIPHVLPLSGLHQKEAVEVVNEEHVEIESPTLWGEESVQFLQPWSEIFDQEQQKLLQMKLLEKNMCGEDTNGWRDFCVGSRPINPPASHTFFTEKNLNNAAVSVDKSGPDYPFLPVDFLGSAAWDRVKCERIVHLQSGGLHLTQPLEMQLGKGLEQNLEFRTEIKHLDTVNALLKFSTSCDLHEALGLAFSREKQNYAWCEAEGTKTGAPIEPLEGMNSTLFTLECGSEHLLEAVVANACRGANCVESETSYGKSSESLVTTEIIPRTPTHLKCACGSAGTPTDQSSFMEENTHHHLTSTWGSTEVNVTKSRKELLSTTLSTCSEQLERRVKPAKIIKKRARPGENCRPRPRDRQLIQDRVKELRELVPNVSKCSIDALLERTIKHMLFLQSISKHADKLRKYAESKLHDKGMDLLGSCSHEYGSSWALEVGSQTEVCPIIVENLITNEHMLVEILCEECSHFLEIAEALRGMGLTILKGVTEVRAEKTWACFVVEAQSNKGMHRMDILWSLMQLLQPKTTI